MNQLVRRNCKLHSVTITSVGFTKHITIYPNLGYYFYFLHFNNLFPFFQCLCPRNIATFLFCFVLTICCGYNFVLQPIWRELWCEWKIPIVNFLFVIWQYIVCCTLFIFFKSCNYTHWRSNITFPCLNTSLRNIAHFQFGILLWLPKLNPTNNANMQLCDQNKNVQISINLKHPHLQISFTFPCQKKDANSQSLQCKKKTNALSN